MREKIGTKFADFIPKEFIMLVENQIDQLIENLKTTLQQTE